MLGTTEIIVIVAAFVALFGTGALIKWAKGVKEVRKILKEDNSSDNKDHNTSNQQWRNV